MAKSFRVVFASFVCLLLLAGAVLAGVYFFIQGRTGGDSVLITQIESGIENALGSDFDVVMEHADLDLSDWGRVAFKTNNVVLKRRSDNLVIANLGEVRAVAALSSLLSQGGGLDRIQIDGAALDLSEFSTGSNLLLPSHLDKPITALGSVLARIKSSLTTQGFEEIRIENSQIIGPVLGRIETSPINIEALTLSVNDAGRLALDGKAFTALSKLNLASSYGEAANSGNDYRFELSGLAMREWLQDPMSQKGAVALDSIMKLSGALSYDDQNQALDPKMSIEFNPGTLRVGQEAKTQLASAQLNFQIFLDRNQIELDPSSIRAGRFIGDLIGGVKPADETLGYAGPLRYDFIIEKGLFEPIIEGEQVIPGAFQVYGVFDRAKKEIAVEHITLKTITGSATGSGVIGLSGETPSTKGRVESDGLSVAALKQFWPYFVADKARDWVHEHILEGRVKSGAVDFDIPSGILFRLKQGEKLAPEHYKAVLELEGFSFRPFGEMPAIKNGKGVVELEGMKVSGRLTEGEASDESGKNIEIRKATFVMEDFAAENRTGEVTMELDGDIRTIASISDRKPLRVMERMKVVPGQFSGKGHADIVAKFPIGRKASYEDIDWNVLLELTNGSSSKPLSGRSFSKANLLIDANPRGANVTGTASLDGVKSRIQFTEPIGKSGKVKRTRNVTATLSDEDRKRLGFNLDPVVAGPVSIEIKQSGGKEIHTLDFTEAEVALPWIGWRKGKGVPAKGGFELKQDGKLYTLNNFYLKGNGFSGGGKMVLNKQGLLSADLSNLKLNEGDDVRLRIEREGDTYNINANGLSFDGRSVLNSLIHSGGFTKAQGQRSVNLVANFDKVKGFNNRIIRNAIMLYESRNGRLTKLDMTAVGSDNRQYSVQAQLNGNDTLFTMKTNDAGNAFAFTDIYSRMQGGVLNANLLQTERGPFLGPVRVTNFEVVNEPRLARMASNVKAQVPTERGVSRRIIPDGEDKVIKFQLADAKIERGKGYLTLQDAIVRSGTMGITMNGQLYDERDRMNITGTFMPANGVNLAVSAIPIFGKLFSNGRDNALIGITYRLRGQRKNPELEVNPLSIVTPGVFNKVFEFQP